MSNIDQLDAEAGGVVHLKNVYCLHKSTALDAGRESATSTTELRITGHNGGAIVCLDDSSRESIEAKASLPVVEMALPVWRKPSDLDESEAAQQDDDDDEIKTVRTIVDRSTPLSTLEQIEEEVSGAEYLADVEVLLVMPGSVDAMCTPYCPRCQKKVEVESGVAVCEEDGAALEYSLDFSLSLRDEHDFSELTVHVRNEEARKLFSNLLANDFLANQATKTHLLDILYALTGGNDPFFPLPPDPRYSYTRPYFRCAIKKLFDSQSSSQVEHSSPTTASCCLVNTAICGLH